MDSRQMAENRSRRMQHGQTVPTWRALFALRRNGYAIDMVCVPAPEQTGTGFRLSCYIPDIGPQGTTRPAISNSEILRDMYGEIRATLLEELMVRQGFPHSSHSNSLPEPCSSNHRQKHVQSQFAAAFAVGQKNESSSLLWKRDNHCVPSRGIVPRMRNQ